MDVANLLRSCCTLLGQGSWGSIQHPGQIEGTSQTLGELKLGDLACRMAASKVLTRPRVGLPDMIPFAGDALELVHVFLKTV